jgi:HSP20 family protein
MAGLIPFNRRGGLPVRAGSGFEDFYNMLDDFFNDGGLLSQRPGRSLLRDTFKLDIIDGPNEYTVEAELPGVSKEEIDLSIDDETLCVSVNHTEETSGEDKNYIHRERRVASMSRRIRLADAKFDEIKAKLEDGVLTVTVPKNIKSAVSRKIDID